jgi:ribosomal protein L11 methyltransferase
MNILAEPLMRLANAANQHLAPEGVMVLSGILQWQETQITQAYASLGLSLSARLVMGDWVTLVWQK